MLMLGNCFPKLNYFRRLIEESLSSQSINKFVIRLPRLIKKVIKCEGNYINKKNIILLVLFL